ncbi:C40 family peptidase [Kushneria indalinina]|uniref:NlpC/P60 family protein n=1 Tax=Kushneria indalinina DSM 14324 TaxID=1122140 RepID=A0A3D9DVH5_9GAMM|nr:C40 family peptidase [Kushneria indalinina]REC94780.1 NlpC/P60 family protein [Kushneria indalinina DSM 14324]
MPSHTAIRRVLNQLSAGLLMTALLVTALPLTATQAHARQLIQPEHGTASELRAKRKREQARARQMGLSETEMKKAAAQGRSLLPQGIAPGVDNFNYKKYAFNGEIDQPGEIAMARAMDTVTDQLGRPYLWGGTTPQAGFDCSGLIYYAFRDLLSGELPRTANGMYHWSQAAPVATDSLKRGDLVFFRIKAASAADHVGVYLGDGRFIQAPRTGENIRISSLEGAYWQRHYLGARRLLTGETVRQLASR